MYEDMDSIIKELIRMDTKARTTLEEAEKARDTEKATILQKKSAVYDESVQNAQHNIEQIKQRLAKNAQEQLDKMEKRYNEANADLYNKYVENKDKWVEHITAECKK